MSLPRYFLLHEEPIGDGMRRILLEELDAIRAALQVSNDAQDGGVHSARKGFKRLRAALRLVRDELGETRFQEQNALLRDAARRLAPLRDSAVLAETLAGLIAAYPAETGAGAFDSIGQRLAARHQDTRARLLETDDRTAEVLVLLQEMRPRLATLPLESTNRDALIRNLGRVYRGGRTRMLAAYRPVAPDDALFHDWRKQVKYLWHQLQILTPIWPALLDEVNRELHNLSDLLGDAHDLAVLSSVVSGESFYFYTAPGVGLLRELAAQRARQLEAAARPLGLRLFAEKPSAFANRLARYVALWQKTGISPAPPALRLLSVREAADRSGLSATTVRRMLQQGELKGEKVGGAWVVIGSDP